MEVLNSMEPTQQELIRYITRSDRLERIKRNLLFYDLFCTKNSDSRSRILLTLGIHQFDFIVLI